MRKEPLLFAFIVVMEICHGISTSASWCGHDEAVRARGPLGHTTQRYAEPGRRRFFANSSAPLRLLYDFALVDTAGADMLACQYVGQMIGSHSCADADLITTAKTSIVKAYMAAAQAFLQSTLQVAPASGGVALPAGAYGDIFLNDDYVAPGADLVIFVTMRPTAVVTLYATGIAIQLDQFDRPIAGHINWNPRAVPTSPTLLTNSTFHGVAIHEAMHVLGFSADMFSLWRNDSGIPLANPVVSADSDNRPMTFLATPRVVAFARQHFACQTALGGALEDQGGTGTAGSHWEKASFMDEIMTGTAGPLSVISGITLAALADSGWYVVDTSKAKWLQWGEGLGCNFFMQRCNASWPRTGGYFCTTAETPGCTYNRHAVGSCLLKSYPTIPSTYQYFGGSPSTGGPIEIADFCPFTYPFLDGWCTRSESSAAGENGERLGASSRCFTSDIATSFLSQSSAQRCYPTRCTSPTELAVQVGSYWYACKDGANISSFIDYVGKLTCPTTSGELCKSAALDPLFPVFVSVSPATGTTGTSVNVTGRGLSNSTVITIGDTCANTAFDAATGTITCTIASSTSIKSILGMKVPVIISQNGYALATADTFELTIDWAAWASRNAFLIFALVLSILILAFMVCVIALKVHDRNAENRRWRARQEARTSQPQEYDVA